MIARRRVALALVVALQATLACSKTEPTESGDALVPNPSRTSSCDRVTAMSVCSEYSGNHLVMNDSVLRSACTKLNGTYVGGECPNTSVIGSCTLATSEVRRYYASGGSAYDAPRAEKECTGSYAGKWTSMR